MHWLAALVILANLLFPITLRNTLQESPEITDLGVSHQFGERITFRVKVQSLADIRELLVYITPEGQPTVGKKSRLTRQTARGKLLRLSTPARLLCSPSRLSVTATKPVCTTTRQSPVKRNPLLRR